MTLYEKIFKKLKVHSGFFGIEVCDHWFLIDLNFDGEGTYQLQVFYDYKAGGCREGSETCIYTGHRRNIKKGYKKSVARLIMQYIITRVNYDVRKYKSSYGTIHDINHGRIIKEYSQTGDFLGWRVTD